MNADSEKNSKMFCFTYLNDRLFSVSVMPTAEFLRGCAVSGVPAILLRRDERSATGEGLRALQNALEFTLCGP